MGLKIVELLFICSICIFTGKCDYERSTLGVYDQAITVGAAGNVALWAAPSADLNKKLGNGKGWYVDFYNYPSMDIPWEDGDADEYVFRFDKVPAEFTSVELFEFVRYALPKTDPVTATEIEIAKFEWVQHTTKLMFNAGIKWEDLDEDDDITLTADEATALEYYRAELQKILAAQHGTPKFYVKQNKFRDEKLVDTKVLLSPFHARAPHNQWILAEQDKTSGKYEIPLLPGIKPYHVDETTNIMSYAKTGGAAASKGTVKFEFSKAHTHLVTITIDGTIVYDIYWFQQKRAQCILHALKAILQDDSIMATCLEFHREHIKFKPIEHPLFTEKQYKKCKACHGTFGTIGKEFYVSEKINEDMTSSMLHCVGYFDICVMETILVGKPKYTLALLEKAKLGGLKWSKQYSRMIDGNPKPFAIWLRVITKGGERHSQVIRKIEAKAGGGKPIWVDLNSYGNPHQVKLPEILDSDDFGEIQAMYLVYTASKFYMVMKGWVKYPVGIHSFAHARDNNELMNENENENENEYGYDSYEYGVYDHTTQEATFMMIWIMGVTFIICGFCVALWCMGFGFCCGYMIKDSHVNKNNNTMTTVEIAENI